MKTRKCSHCDSNKTYVFGKGFSQWYRNPAKPSEYLCSRCYTRLYKNPKYNPIFNPANNAKRINFKGRWVYVGVTTRTGVCNLCRNVVPFDTKRTEMHHEAYHDENPLEDTIELCAQCHRKTRRKNVVA